MQKSFPNEGNNKGRATQEATIAVVASICTKRKYLEAEKQIKLKALDALISIETYNGGSSEWETTKMLQVPLPQDDYPSVRRRSIKWLIAENLKEGKPILESSKPPIASVHPASNHVCRK